MSVYYPATINKKVEYKNKHFGDWYIDVLFDSLVSDTVKTSGRLPRHRESVLFLRFIYHVKFAERTLRRANINSARRDNL